MPTQLLFREGVQVPDDLQHLPNVSPQLQVLALAFLGALGFLSKDGGVVCWQPLLLIDRHRAHLMARDSICFGVCVDGVCAVGCRSEGSVLCWL